MTGRRVVWDKRTSDPNGRKHGMTFAEAETVFLDEDALRSRQGHEDPIASFKSLAHGAGIPYQAVIDLYLRDCAAHRRGLAIRWKSAA